MPTAQVGNMTTFVIRFCVIAHIKIKLHSSYCLSLVLFYYCYLLLNLAQVKCYIVYVINETFITTFSLTSTVLGLDEYSKLVHNLLYCVYDPSSDHNKSPVL